MRPRIPHRHTSVTNTTIINTRFQIRRNHPDKVTGTINLLPATYEVIVSEHVVYNRLIGVGCVGRIAVGVGGIGAGVRPVDILTGDELGAGVVGGACDVVVGVAVCGGGGAGASVGDGDAVDLKVAGFEAVDVGICVEDCVAVGADEIETAGYDVGVVEDGFEVAAVVGRASGGAADGLVWSGAGGGGGGEGCICRGDHWCRG